MFCQLIVKTGGDSEYDISDDETTSESSNNSDKSLQIIDTAKEISKVAAEEISEIAITTDNESDDESIKIDSTTDNESDEVVAAKSESEAESEEESESVSGISIEEDIGAIGGGDSEDMYFYLIESDNKVYIIKKDNSLYVYAPNNKVESLESDLMYDVGADLDSDKQVKVINMITRGSPTLPRAASLMNMISEARPVKNSVAFLLTTYRAVKLLKVMIDIGNVEISDYITYNNSNGAVSQKAAAVITHQDPREGSIKESAAGNAARKSRATLLKYLDILRHLHTRAILMTYNYQPVHVFNDFRASPADGVGGINIMNAAYVAEYDPRNIVWDIIESDRDFQKAAANLVPNYGGDTQLGDESAATTIADGYRQGDFLQIIKICSLIDIRNAIKYSRTILSAKETIKVNKILSPSNMSADIKSEYNCATLFPIEHMINLLSDKKIVNVVNNKYNVLSR